MQDPSWGDASGLGYKNFTYNALGEVLTEIDPKNVAVSMEYDQLGRLVSRSVNGEFNGMWYYDNTDTYKGLGYLDFEDSQFRDDGSRLQKFYYYSDSATGRKDLLQVTHRFYENDDQNDFTDYATQTFTDGYYARPKGLRYPGGAILAYAYNTAGFVIKEKDPVTGIQYREITERSSRGQVKAASLANHGAGFQYSYSANYAPQTGQMNSLQVLHNATALHQLSYLYEDFGNLASRSTVYGAGATETLEYDALHRLKKSTRTIGAGSPLVVDYNYDPNGNITNKSDHGSYDYSTTQPNRLVRTSNFTVDFDYDDNGNIKKKGGQTLVYNAFNKPISIQEGTAGLQTVFTYGADILRYRQINPAGETVYYIDKLMEIETAGTEANYRHYISDVAILTKTGDLSDPNPSIDYIHRDRLGSIVNITDETGIIEEGRGFDAFGKPRNGDWSDKSPATINSSITDRGFTEHEHLDTHELIHMNGRGYDYGLGRFLSIDPIVQAPGNSQSWNPYSYIMNNPLGGVDPTGYVSEVEPVTQTITVAPTGSHIKHKVEVTSSLNAAGGITNQATGGGGGRLVKQAAVDQVSNGVMGTANAIGTQKMHDAQGLNADSINSPQQRSRSLEGGGDKGNIETTRPSESGTIGSAGDSRSPLFFPYSTEGVEYSLEQFDSLVRQGLDIAVERLNTFSERFKTHEAQAGFILGLTNLRLSEINSDFTSGKSLTFGGGTESTVAMFIVSPNNSISSRERNEYAHQASKYGHSIFWATTRWRYLRSYRSGRSRQEKSYRYYEIDSVFRLDPVGSPSRCTTVVGEGTCH